MNNFGKIVEEIYENQEPNPLKIKLKDLIDLLPVGAMLEIWVNGKYIARGSDLEREIYLYSDYYVYSIEPDENCLILEIQKEAV